MSKRLRRLAVWLAASLAALFLAGLVVLVEGSENFAWWLVTFGVGFAVWGVLDASGLENWLKRASPTWQWVYLTVSLAVLLGMVAVYLISQSIVLWWLAPLAVLPLYFFLDARGERGGGGESLPPTPPS